MMKQLLLALVLLLLTFPVLCGAKSPHTNERVKYKNGPAFIYRLYLADKKGSSYSLNHPSRFLSRRSIERRKRQHLSVDSTDMPVSDRYLRLIEQQPVSIIGKSRWQNTVLVRMKDSTIIHQLEQLKCVTASKLVWISPDSVTPTATKTPYHNHFEERDSAGGILYGKNDNQIRLLQGHRLHQIGLRGEDMMIAIIDGGFKNVNRISAFQQIDIRGYQDFVTPASPNIFAETDHGTKVLSAMAINSPYFYIGTAPKASYWLLRSEDQQTEQEVEEDYWAMAAEFADSVGCDLINSSLGYHEYDHPWMSHKLRQLDGHSAFISRSASFLASKGIILVNSAGNSGMGPWKKIGVPADADNILTVGAITDDKPYHVAPFSSVGPSQDGRIKPDVMAIGAPAFLVNGRGVIMEDMGTSFSAPTICGLVACLWQGLPHKSAIDILRLIRENSDNHENPDNIYGYGVPNFWRTYMKGKAEYNEYKKDE